MTDKETDKKTKKTRLHPPLHPPPPPPPPSHPHPHPPPEVRTIHRTLLTLLHPITFTSLSGTWDTGNKVKKLLYEDCQLGSAVMRNTVAMSETVLDLPVFAHISSSNESLASLVVLVAQGVGCTTEKYLLLESCCRRCCCCCC